MNQWMNQIWKMSYGQMRQNRFFGIHYVCRENNDEGHLKYTTLKHVAL